MDSVNITNARRNLYQLVEQAIVSSRPVRISGKSGDVVLLSAADWSAIEETLYLHSVPGLAEDILAGAQEPLEECASLEDIGWPPID